MYTNRIILSLAALLLSTYLVAQIDVHAGQHASILSTWNLEPYQVDIIDGIATMRYSNAAASIKGSPYLNNDFEEGSMTTLDGTIIPGLLYRYDIYGDRMQFIINGDTATINKPLALRSLELGNRKFVYDVFLVEAGKVATGYFEVIEENENLTVLYRREIELEQDVYVSNYGGGGGTKEFRMKKVNSYFIKPIDSAALQVRNKKDFLNTISHHQADVKQYMKEHKISIKKEKDLLQVARYYNSLQMTDS